MEDAALRGTCILVVDDDESVRDMIALMLHTEGCEVLKAEDGATALARFHENWRKSKMAADQPKRISGLPCPSCGKPGSEVQPSGSHRCRFCGTRWNPSDAPVRR